jgi:hypothetical protein
MAQVDEQIESISSSEDAVGRGCGPTKCAVSIQRRKQCREKKDAIRFSPHVPGRFSNNGLPSRFLRVALPVERSAVISLRVPSNREACSGCCGGRGRGGKSQGRGGRKRGVEATGQGDWRRAGCRGKAKGITGKSLEGGHRFYARPWGMGKSLLVAGTMFGVGEMAGVESRKEVVVAPLKGALFAKSRSEGRLISAAHRTRVSQG